jgi:hypothetical protein
MADKTIKVKVNVDLDAEPSIAQLKALKKELKNTEAGTEEFQKLQQAINDMQVAIKSAKTGAGNFTEVLSGLPGPIGDLSGKVSGAVNTLKQFGGLKLTDIKASFVEFGKQIGDSLKGLGQLTGITKAYTVVNNTLSKSFIAVGVGEEAAAIGAKALSAALIATGIGALVVALGLAFNALKELVTGEEAAARATAEMNREIENQNTLLELNAKDTERRNKVEIAQLKAQGASAQEIRDRQLLQAKEKEEQSYKDLEEASDLYNKNLGKADTETFKKLQDNLDKRQQAYKDSVADRKVVAYNNKADELKEEDAKNKELAGKQKAASDKAIENKKRELAELKKGLEDARLNSLSAQGKEEGTVNDKYNKLKGLAEKYGQDTAVIEAGREKELKDIREKYAKENLDKKKKEIDDQLALDEQGLNLRLAKGEIKEKEFNTKLFELRKNAAMQAEIAANASLANDADALDKALQKNKDYVTAQIDLEKYNLEQKKKIAEEDRGIIATRLQSQIEALDAENQRIQGDYEQDLERLKEKRDLLAEAEANELSNTELNEFEKTQIRKKYADERKKVTDEEIATEKAAAEAKHAINIAYLGLFEQFGNILQQVAGKNKALAIAGVIISQAAAIGQIISNTGVANAKAVAASPLTGGMPWVAINTVSAALSIAAAVASAAKSIQQINQAASQAGVQGGGGSAASAPNIEAPRVATAAAPQIQTTGGQNPTTAIAETIGRAQAPIKAYVVSGEISSQQALDRRTSTAATFSGG